MSETKERLDAVQAAIAEAGAARPGGAVTLIAVSKTWGPEHVRPALEAGHRDFGENRVQEAAAKWPALREEYSDVRLHLIGPLQSNKAADAVALFDVIHTVDRPKIARAIASECEKQGRDVETFMQVNTGEEAQKSGVAPDEAVAFVESCRERGLAPAGLMCIPPAQENPGPHFALLAKLAAEAGLDGLSMGMSGDYEIAIRMGATHVRVGSAIFGARDHG